MPPAKGLKPFSTRERRDRILGRVLRNEAECGATFEELLACCPGFERRLLDLTVARLDSSRAPRLPRRGTPAPVRNRAGSSRRRMLTGEMPG